MNTPSGKLERWLGVDEVERISRSMRGWYGPPIAVDGVPGAVFACGDGDFTGRIYGGAEATARCYIHEMSRRLRRATTRHGTLQAGGFATIADLLTSSKNGRRETVQFNKTGINVGGAGGCGSAWRVATTPVAGAVAGAAPGGTQYTSASQGAAYFMNAKSGEKSLYAGGWLSSGSTASTILVYDRLFAVAKTMSSTTAEAVTGVPPRYQSTTPLDADYAAGNFLFLDITTGLSSTAHNWTVCTYTDQDGNTGATLPSVVGLSSGPGVGRMDMPANTWFTPLATGDTGVKALTQMQCDASVTGGIDFTIGRPLAWIPGFLVAVPCVVGDGIRSAFNLVRIFDDACLAFLYIATTTSAPVMVGSFDIVSG